MSALYVRPISDRTPFGIGNYKNSPFTVTYATAMDLLQRELDFLDASNVVVELDVTENQVRIDGTLRADARPSTPCVRLAFDSSQGPLTYATDEFVKAPWRREGMKADWQHNLYAIAKGLESLRMLARYGITRRGEQYQGWKALPAGQAMPASHMTSDEAWSILGAFGDHPIAVARLGDPRPLLRKARSFAHPDRHDGDRTLWDQVEQAARVLGVAS